MKKIVLTIGAILVLGIALFVIFGNGEWNIYENSRYEFSVEYPARWSLGEAPANNDGREFISPDKSITCWTYGFQNSLINQNGEPQSLDEFTDWLTENLGSDEVLEKSDTSMSGLPAVELIMQMESTISQGIYVLGYDSGRGLVCYYPDITSLEDFQADFEKMRKSFYLNTSLDGGIPKELGACEDHLAGVFTPFKDRQIFTDTDYTEVTITSRDYWDREKLPEEVTLLEVQGYTCYPMPMEFDYTEPEGDVLAQPAVTAVEWSCELEYNEWKYFSKEGFDLGTKKTEGYQCKKQDCWQDPSGEDFLWLCTK